MTEPLKSVVFPRMKPGPDGRQAEATFLYESNLIEDEPGALAMIDAWEGWKSIKEAFDPEWDWPIIEPQESVLHAHFLLLQHLRPEIAGQWRNVDVGVGPRLCMGPKQALANISVLLDEPLPETEESIRAWHVRFETIHPFTDGNGRTGRILMNAQRLRARLPILIIPARHRHAYYEWFK